MINGFTATQRMRKLFPAEDFFSFEKFQSSGEEMIIMTAADGITRDPIIPFTNWLPDVKTKLGLFAYGLGYIPHGFRTPATEAAMTFTEVFPFYLKDILELDYPLNPDLISKAFNYANRVIGNIQPKKDSDFLVNDRAGCVASAAVIQGREAYYGFITDSGFAIFDSAGRSVFRTPNEMVNAEDHIPGYDQRNPKHRVRWRRDFRNKPENVSPTTGEKTSFGALTGEEEAMPYVRTGVHSLSPGDTVMVYTDGLENTLFNTSGKKLGRVNEIASLIGRREFDSLRELCETEVEYEGTLVYHVVE